MAKIICITGFFVFSFFQLLAQDIRNLNESQQMMKMDEGVEFMNQGNFEKAEELFREVLLEVEVVPADLCFYFGKNSYQLNKYSQSIDWLNKYIELKGTSGRFFDAAVEYLKLAEEDYKSDSQIASQTKNTALKKKKELVDCQEAPFVVCPVCEGDGVIIERGSLGTSIYKACHYCKETGRMSCENYKRYMAGDLELENENNQ